MNAHLADGELPTPVGIAERLNGTGYRTAQSKAFRASTVVRIVRPLQAG